MVVDARTHRTPVVAGPEFGDRVQIVRGLDGTETVVIGTPPALRDGQPVTVNGGK
jgi:hypothetical protein